jgi:hypothetical protein
MAARKGMRRRHAEVIAAFIGVAAAAGSPASGQGERNTGVRVKEVSLSGKSFDPQRNESVRWEVLTSAEAKGEVRIFDPFGALERTLPLSPAPSPGSGVSAGDTLRYAAVWDGRDEAGRAARPGAYVYTVEFVNAGGEKASHDPFAETYGYEIEPSGARYDPGAGAVQYALPKPALVRVCAGLRDGPLLRTLVDWEPREAGSHAERWDGLDKNGLMDLSRHPRLDIAISAFSLAANTVIVLGSNLSTLHLPSSQSDPPAPFVKNKDLTPSREGRYPHALHPRDRCREPSFRIEWGARSGATEERSPVVGGVVPVRVVLNESDKAMRENARFEIVLFVDGVFLWEEENGLSPTTYLWDTKRLNDGAHTLTANLYAFDDHVGAESRRVWVRNGGGPER